VPRVLRADDPPGGQLMAPAWEGTGAPPASGGSGRGGARRKVVAVSMGQAHATILTADGRLWMTGLRGRGRLYDDSDLLAAAAGDAAGEPAGLPSAQEASAAAAAAPASEEVPLPETYMQTTPLYIPPGPLAGKRVLRLRSGLHHSFAVTADGEVYRWGWKGIVHAVPELAGLRVADVHYGYCHAVVLAP
jgi:hypothetical protein